MRPPKKQSGWRRAAANAGALVFLAVAVLAMWALVGSLIREWRSGAAFVRYRNWRGMFVSHAEMLVFLAVAALAMIVGGVWSAIDRWRDRRSEDKTAKHRRAG